ncbi:MAG: TRAM domain-containing protein, partial [Cyanobacteria bacterium J06649_11]
QQLMDERRDILMQIQQPISWKRNQQEIGKIVDVLIEQENPIRGELIGRSSRFAPEVDGQIYVRGEASLGSIVKVKINEADAYDLYGEVVTAF